MVLEKPLVKINEEVEEKLLEKIYNRFKIDEKFNEEREYGGFLFGVPGETIKIIGFYPDKEINISKGGIEFSSKYQKEALDMRKHLTTKESTVSIVGFYHTYSNDMDLDSIHKEIYKRIQEDEKYQRLFPENPIIMAIHRDKNYEFFLLNKKPIKLSSGIESKRTETFKIERFEI